MHRRHRLGHRPLLHRLRPARQRCDPGDVRRRAELPGLRPLLGHHRANTGHDLLHRTDRHPRASSSGATISRAARSFIAPTARYRSASRSTPKPGCGTTSVIGGGACPIVDTWWQTETGAIMISPLPGATPTQARLRDPALLRHRRRHRRRSRATSAGPTRAAASSSASPGRRCCARICGDDERYKQNLLVASIPASTTRRRRRAARRGRLFLDHGPRRRRDQRLRSPPRHGGGRKRARSRTRPSPKPPSSAVRTR